MNFLGPRPERFEVYERLCRHLTGYDARFAIKPGLVGFSQLYTPHSAPKRLRSLADNRLLRSRPCVYPVRGVLLVACAVAAVTKTTAGRLLRFAWHDILESKVLRRYREKRELTRMRLQNATALIEMDDGRIVGAPIIDINERAFLVPHPERLPATSSPLRLRIEVKILRRSPTARRRSSRRLSACRAGSRGRPLQSLVLI